MKKVILVVSLMFGGATLVSAQETQTRTQSQTETSIQQDQDKQKISVSELPEGVTAKLESQDYSGWTVGEVYKKSDETQNEIYIVEMRQGTETKKVKFDRDGNQLDKGDKDMDKSRSSNYRDDTEQDASQQDATQYDATEQDATEQDATEQDATEQDATEHDAADQADNTELEQDQQ